jgi:hypothetical protein
VGLCLSQLLLLVLVLLRMLPAAHMGVLSWHRMRLVFSVGIVSAPSSSQVAQERGEEGPARQAAVAAALQLINAALTMDVGVAEDLTRLSSRDTLHPLDRLLKIQKHLQHLLLYVRYDACPEIQLQVSLAATLRRGYAEDA